MAELLYEGKAKQVYKTDKEDEYLIHYKDDATAGNGVKHDKFEGKGVLNNTISCIIFDMLEEAGIKTHMIKKLNERDKKIMILRYGLFGNEEITQKDVADMLGISQSYISRIEKKVIKRLKNIVKI